MDPITFGAALRSVLTLGSFLPTGAPVYSRAERAALERAGYRPAGRGGWIGPDGRLLNTQRARQLARELIAIASVARPPTFTPPKAPRQATPPPKSPQPAPAPAPAPRKVPRRPAPSFTKDPNAWPRPIPPTPPPGPPQPGGNVPTQAFVGPFPTQAPVLYPAPPDVVRGPIWRRALPRILGRVAGVLGWILWPSEIGKERPVEVWEIPVPPKGPPRRPRIMPTPEWPIERWPYTPPDIWSPNPRVPDPSARPEPQPSTRPGSRPFPLPGTLPRPFPAPEAPPRPGPRPVDQPRPYPTPGPLPRAPAPRPTPRPGTRPGTGPTPGPGSRPFLWLPFFPFPGPGASPSRPAFPRPSNPPDFTPDPLTPLSPDPLPFGPPAPPKPDQSRCQCQKERPKRKKRKCRNPVVSTRTEYAAGRKYVISKRWIKCQA